MGHDHLLELPKQSKQSPIHPSSNSMDPIINGNVVTPHIMNLRLKKINNIINLCEDYDMAVEELDMLTQRPYDVTYFDESLQETIKERLDMAIMLLWLNTASEALVVLKGVRSLLDPIFVQNLWFANRILTPGKDIGILEELPDLVKFEIRKHLYCCL